MKSDLKQWDAGKAEERIAIITIDREFDQRVRTAFYGEAYELITIEDFQTHESDLLKTCIAILDARTDAGWEMLRYIRASLPWMLYPMIGIVQKQERSDLLCSCFVPKFDMELVYPFHLRELVEFTKRIRAVTLEELEGEFRI